MSLPGLFFDTLSIGADKRKREVQPKAIIDAFVRNYEKELDRVGAVVATFDPTTGKLTDDDRGDKLKLYISQVETRRDELAASIAKIRADSKEYMSEAAKAARAADPRLGMSDAEKERLKARFKEETAELESLGPKIDKGKRALAMHKKGVPALEWILKHSYAASLNTDGRNKVAPDYFEAAVRLFLTPRTQEFLNAKRPFWIRVTPWAKDEFKIFGRSWVDDLAFNRILLGLIRSQTSGIRTDHSDYDGQTIAFWKGTRGAKVALAMALARVAVNAEFHDADVARAYEPGAPREGLLGWDVPLGLDTAPQELKDAFRGLLRAAGQASNAGRLIQHLLDGGSTRKLALRLKPGDTSAKGRTAKFHCLEYGLGGQRCSKIEKVLAKVRASNDVFLDLDGEVLTKRNIKDSRFASLDRSRTMVAMIIWGGHARVIFDTNGPGHAAIVDPWKSADNVRIPPDIQTEFRPWGQIEWIERAPEQCGEGSCTLVALTRALILALHNHKVEPMVREAMDAQAEGFLVEYDRAAEMRRAAQCDALDPDFHGPACVALARLAHMVVDPVASLPDEVWD